MTDSAAMRLKVELDAMRIARRADHKECARLTARVAELEQEVARLQTAPPGVWGALIEAVSKLRGRWSYADDCDHKRSSCEEIGCFGSIFRAYEAAVREPTRLAEGTRDETAERRCADCDVPIEIGWVCRACGAEVTR
jgi:hypothetical protein